MEQFKHHPKDRKKQCEDCGKRFIYMTHVGSTVVSGKKCLDCHVQHIVQQAVERSRIRRAE